MLKNSHESQKDPDFTATLIGLDKSVQDRIQFIQQISDNRLIEVYNQASVVAVPSLAEGFGLPVVEALARQRPVVATRGTALVELANFLPVTLVEAHSPQEWASALQISSDNGLESPVEIPLEIPLDWDDFTTRLEISTAE